METNFSFKVKNYKCFGDNEQGFENVMPINVIIGKNNSGKSSLIDIIPYLISPSNSFFLPGSKTEVIVSHKLSESVIRRNFPENKSGGYISHYRNHFEYGKKFINTNIYYRLVGNEKIFIKTEVPIEVEELKSDFEAITRSLKNPFSGKKFYYITAERNIIPEIENIQTGIKPNGEGVTNLVTNIVNRAQYDSRLIQQKLFTELLTIVQPDIELHAIIPQKLESGEWEIFFEAPDETRIALSKMGSGIKTILQVLSNLLVLPDIEGRKLEDCVFAFEELENNLHPAMQRRLFQYLKHFAINNNTVLFITIHSSIVIDIFGSDVDTQIVHTKKQGASTLVRSTQSFEANKSILRDLDVRASDILQSNGIIWVEGPSDRNYINKWISLIDPVLKEGLHYSILPYGGKLLANLCFDYEWLQNELIPLLRINTNAFVVIDKDAKTVSDKLNNTKLRIQREIGEQNCWITKGREIENYLSKSTLEKWLEEKHNIKGSVNANPYEKIEHFLNSSIENLKVKYNSSKSIYSNEIVDFINYKDLEILDLKHRINFLVATIKDWNTN